MFEFKEISKTFRADFWEKKFTVLNQLSFKVEEGGMCGFLGVNGAGKTTSLKILLDFITPDSGEVCFSKNLGNTKDQIFSQLGFMPERPYFYPDLTGMEFLVYMGRLSKLSKIEIKLNIEKWSKELNIEYALKRKIKTFSKGMLQRLGFVATLIHNPQLLILDEPMSGLDPIGRKEFKNVFKTLNDMGKTIFFSSHIVHDIEEICDDAVVIDNGKLFYSGNLNDLLLKNSKENYEISFIEQGFSHVLNLNSYDEARNFINESIGVDKKLISFNRKITSLEEIIYKVKND